MVLVDTNVLLDVVQDDLNWADWSLAQLRAQSQVHALAINPVIYAELAAAYQTIERLEKVVTILELAFEEIPRPALFLAAKAHAAYRERGGTRPTVLPDFFIGAHAAVRGWPLITRDRRRYASAFPRLQLISPPA